MVFIEAVTGVSAQRLSCWDALLWAAARLNQSRSSGLGSARGDRARQSQGVLSRGIRRTRAATAAP
jgi:hypothetical protein